MNRFYFDRSHIFGNSVKYSGHKYSRKNNKQINHYTFKIKLNQAATNFLNVTPVLAYVTKVSIRDADFERGLGFPAQLGLTEVLYRISPPYIDFDNEDDLVYFTMIV